MDMRTREETIASYVLARTRKAEDDDPKFLLRSEIVRLSLEIAESSFLPSLDRLHSEICRRFQDSVQKNDANRAMTDGLIRKHFRRLARFIHPDRASQSSVLLSKEQMERLWNFAERAYEVLSDSSRRRKYDLTSRHERYVEIEEKKEAASERERRRNQTGLLRITAGVPPTPPKLILTSRVRKNAFVHIQCEILCTSRMREIGYNRVRVEMRQHSFDDEGITTNDATSDFTVVKTLSPGTGVFAFEVGPLDMTTTSHTISLRHACENAFGRGPYSQIQSVTFRSASQKMSDAIRDKDEAEKIARRPLVRAERKEKRWAAKMSEHFSFVKECVGWFEDDTEDAVLESDASDPKSDDEYSSDDEVIAHELMMRLKRLVRAHEKFCASRKEASALRQKHNRTAAAPSKSHREDAAVNTFIEAYAVLVNLSKEYAQEKDPADAARAIRRALKSRVE
eukprot:g1585.t1